MRQVIFCKGCHLWHLRIGIESLLEVYIVSHLRKLKLMEPATWQTLSGQHIRQISRKYPLLVDLELSIDGTQSHAEKIGIYAALGSMRNLQLLDLTHEVHVIGLPGISREEILSESEPPRGVGRSCTEFRGLPNYSFFGESQIVKEHPNGFRLFSFEMALCRRS